MNTYSPPYLYNYSMCPGDLLAIRRGGDGVIRCLEGTVLVSLQGCLTDFDLAPGKELAIDGNPLVLIESCSDARILIHAPRKTYQGVWAMVGLLMFFGLASALAEDVPSVRSRPNIGEGCTPNAHEKRIKNWRLGRGMIDASEVASTNRVIASYERMHSMKECTS